MYCCSCPVFTICAICNVISPVKYVFYFYISTFHSVCAAPNMAVFAAPWFRPFLVCRSIIIIIIIIISFMRGICTYIPEKNYVLKEYSVAAILSLLFMVLISLDPVLNLLYFYISTFRSMCAVPNIAVFCSSLTSCFPVMLLTYFLNDFEIVPVAPITVLPVSPLFLNSTCAVFLL